VRARVVIRSKSLGYWTWIGQLVFAPGRAGLPAAMDGVYVSVPTVVPDFTVKYA